MLFDLGWSEILLIGVVALVFIGPKDLPKALRVAGFWVRKARNLSREFQSSIDQMIREAELDEMRQDLKKATEFDLDQEFHNTIDPAGTSADRLKPPELPSPAPAEGLPSPVVEGEVEVAAEVGVEPTVPFELASDGAAPSAAVASELGSAEPAAAAAAAGSGERPDGAVRDIVPPKP